MISYLAIRGKVNTISWGLRAEKSLRKIVLNIAMLSSVDEQRNNFLLVMLSLLTENAFAIGGESMWG